MLRNAFAISYAREKKPNLALSTDTLANTNRSVGGKKSRHEARHEARREL